MRRRQPSEARHRPRGRRLTRSGSPPSVMTESMTTSTPPSNSCTRNHRRGRRSRPASIAGIVGGPRPTAKGASRTLNASADGEIREGSCCHRKYTASSPTDNPERNDGRGRVRGAATPAARPRCDRARRPGLFRDHSGLAAEGEGRDGGLRATGCTWPRRRRCQSRV